MNPFDLRGPEFLLLYASYGCAVLLAMTLVRWHRESGPAPRLDLADPYLVAYLRGGTSEAVRVALLGLADRKLVIPGELDWKAAEGAAEWAKHPLEQAIVRQLGDGDRPSRLLWDDQVEAAGAELRRKLEGLGLMPDERVRQARVARSFLTMVLLAAPAAVKIGVALSRGRTNVLFLVVLAALFAYLAIHFRGGRLTGKGTRVLQDLRQLFAGLRRRAERIAPGGATSELALLAAVFGIVAVPVAVFPHVGDLTAGWKAEAATGRWGRGDGSSSSASSCSSSCGSSSGSSCGGGCGGGGCGGCGS